MVLFVLIASASFAEEKKALPPAQTINAKDVKAMIDSGNDIVIVDVRPVKKYLKSDIKIKGAIRIYKFDEETKALLKGKLIVTYDDSPGNAAGLRAASLIASKGFPDVKAMEGGLRAWRFYDFPLENR